LILKREPYALDVEAVLEHAARHGAAVEINSQIDRLDLNEHHARRARALGVPIVISSDAHSRHGLGVTRWGVSIARRAWLEPRNVLNTLPFDEFSRALRRRRR
jgi:DNA polymerase (family 10)